MNSDNSSDDYRVQHRWIIGVSLPFCHPDHVTDLSHQQSVLPTPIKTGSNLLEKTKGKVNLVAKIIQKGGRKHLFKKEFKEFVGEKLLKASQCYLPTPGGLIAGLLFISTHRLAFYSERSIEMHSPNRESVRKHYKVWIPLNMIKERNERENEENPAQKYIQIVTADNFEFRFMRFMRYEKAFHSLKKVL